MVFDTRAYHGYQHDPFSGQLKRIYSLYLSRFAGRDWIFSRDLASTPGFGFDDSEPFIHHNDGPSVTNAGKCRGISNAKRIDRAWGKR